MEECVYVEKQCQDHYFGVESTSPFSSTLGPKVLNQVSPESSP